MRDATFLIWLAVIAFGSQLIAVFVMWQLQRLTMLEAWSLQRGRDLTREERLAQYGDEARILAEASADALRAAQVGAVRDEVRRAFEEAAGRCGCPEAQYRPCERHDPDGYAAWAEEGMATAADPNPDYGKDLDDDEGPF